MLLRRLFISLTFFAVLTETTLVGHAADVTDSDPPIVSSISKLQDLPSRGNTLVYEINMLDEKNSFQLVGGGGGGKVRFKLVFKDRVAPVCGENTDVNAGWQIVPTSKGSVQNASGLHVMKLFLIIYLQKPSARPQGCPEPISSGVSSSSVELTFIDVVGNQTRFNFPMDSLHLNLISDPKKHCYYPPYPNQVENIDDPLSGTKGSYRDWFENQLKFFDINIASLAVGSVPAQAIINDYLASHPRLAVALNYPYLEKSKDGFDLRGFNEFPLCPEVVDEYVSYRFTYWVSMAALPVWVVPWFSDTEWSPVRSALIAKVAEIKAEAEAKAKAEAEAKAKAEAEAKAKAEAEAKTASAKKKITITCVNGKTTKKVRAIDPKCPKGYKKK